MRTLFALVAISSLVGCPIDGAATGKECSQSLKELSDLCPPGTMIEFQAEASGKCGADGKYQPMTQGAELGGTCESQGACEVACIATGLTCPCGVRKITRDEIECREDCSPDCGNGECDSGETKANCPGDCAPPPMSSEEDPMMGDAGEGDAGSGGAGRGGSSGGKAGAGGSRADAGTGSETATCGQPRVFGRYLVREDGVALLMEGNAQTPVLDAETARPVEGIEAVADGAGFGCGMLADGQVVCWPLQANTNNGQGQLGNGTMDDSGAFRATTVLTGPGAPLADVVALASSVPYTAVNTGVMNVACAITKDTKLYCWGNLTWIVSGGAVLHSAYAQAVTTNGLDELTGVKQAAVHQWGACALLAGEEADEVWCWGVSGHGQNGDMMNRQYATKILGLTNPTAIAMSTGYTGARTICAVDEGKVRCWGSGVANGSGGGADLTAPTLVKLADETTTLDGVSRIVGGYQSLCALRSGKLFCWGQNYDPYADNYGATSVVDVGSSTGPLFLTSDGKYHLGGMVLTPKCGEP